MYFQILDTNNQPLRKIIANDYDSACDIAKQLEPAFAFVIQISHAEFHVQN